MQPKVSMVIPCYNKESYIDNMIQSVNNQVWDNIEVIFVDDGSTDKTAYIIKQWIPKLQNRGYEVILITQNNQGVTGAVLNGLLNMTGEYFCQVDCDDNLYPEYVSTMASCLRDNADYDWVSCDYESFYIDDNSKPPVRQVFAALPGSPHVAENFLLHRICMTVWIYMVRVEYIKRCRLVENFCIRPPISQEPPVIIPLAISGGKLKHIPIVLYKYNLSSNFFARMTTIENAQDFISTYSRQVENTIKQIHIDEQERARYLAVAWLAQIKWTCLCLNSLYKNQEQKRLLIEETINSISHMLTPVPDFNCETVIRVGVNVFFHAVENCVLKVGNKYLNTDFKFKGRGRVIGYGALSWCASNLLKALCGTPMQPDLLWDKAASAGSSQNGASVVKTDLSQLMSDDTVLIFSNNLYVIDEIKAIVRSCGVVSVWTYFDMLEYLAAYYFPETQVLCSFTG